jgi:branched-chain amino acid transport system permease protein
MELGTATVLLANGLALAAILFLLSSGLTLIFGLMNVVNFAHGAMFLVGGYVTLTVTRHITGSLLLSLLSSVVVLAVIGLLIERVFLRRFYGPDLAAHLRQVLLTLGLTLVITELVRIFYGPQILAVSLNWQGERVELAGRLIPLYRLVLIGIGLGGFAGLSYLLNRTRLGLVVRAGVQRADMVEALGIDVHRTFSFVFVIGAALAGLAGAAAGPYYNAVFPTLGDDHLILAFGIVVVGGLGSVAGSAVASLMIGVLISFGAFFWPAGQSFFVMMLLVIVLLVRPQGLFGRQRTRV